MVLNFINLLLTNNFVFYILNIRAEVGKLVFVKCWFLGIVNKCSKIEQSLQIQPSIFYLGWS